MMRTEIGRLADGEAPLFVSVIEAPADDGDPDVLVPCVEISDGETDPIYLAADDAAYLGELLARGADLIRMIERRGAYGELLGRKSEVLTGTPESGA